MKILVCNFIIFLNTKLEILIFLTLRNDKMFPFSGFRVNSSITGLEICQLLTTVLLMTRNAVSWLTSDSQGSCLWVHCCGPSCHRIGIDSSLILHCQGCMARPKLIFYVLRYWFLLRLKGPVSWLKTEVSKGQPETIHLKSRGIFVSVFLHFLTFLFLSLSVVPKFICSFIQQMFIKCLPRARHSSRC